MDQPARRRVVSAAAAQKGGGGDQVRDALCALSRDPGTRDRLAVASVMLSHGESIWAFEIAYQIWCCGGTAYRERSAGGISRVDLVVAGEAFELKSTFWEYALRASAAATREWMIKDAEKLRTGAAPGYQLITMATLVDASHLRFGPLIRASRATGDRAAGRGRALSVYQQYAASVSVGPASHVDLGVGAVPGNRGTVQLDALLACVHEPPQLASATVSTPPRGAPAAGGSADVQVQGRLG
jgi:hypothetical protein